MNEIVIGSQIVKGKAQKRGFHSQHNTVFFFY